MKQIWLKTNNNSIKSKFEQDVFSVVRSIQGVSCRFDCTDVPTGLEIDIVISKFEEKECKIAMETNGVYHYSRNSERKIGKDVIKHKILARQGYKIIVIPYFEHYIIEDQMKPKFLRDVIHNALNTN